MDCDDITELVVITDSEGYGRIDEAELSNCGPWQTILKSGTTAPGTFTIRWGDKDDPDCEPVEF